MTTAASESIAEEIRRGDYTIIGLITLLWETASRTLERVDALEARVRELQARGDSQ